MMKIVMLFLLYLSFYFGSTSGLDCDGNNRIVGGQPANIEDFPYQLAVEAPGFPKIGHFCGASIIGPYWALTAAHCVHTWTKDKIQVRSGTNFLDRGGEVHKVERIIVHPLFTDIFDYDVGLIKVYNRFKYSAVAQPIQLATRTPSPGTSTIVSGWGWLSFTSKVKSSKLLQVAVDIIDQKTCKQMHRNRTITSRMLCAGVPQGGKDACVGDSGGPLVVGNTQVGIVSWGVNCGLKHFPGVYTDVSELREWINSKIRMQLQRQRMSARYE